MNFTNRKSVLVRYVVQKFENNILKKLFCVKFVENFFSKREDTHYSGEHRQIKQQNAYCSQGPIEI